MPASRCGRGRHHVTTGEGRTRRRQLILGRSQLDHAHRPAEHGHRRGEEPVVGPDEIPVLDLDRDTAPLAADTGIDDRQHDPLRQVLHGAHERERAGAHVERRDVMGDVDDPRRGRDVEDHGVADAHELVRPSVIRQERDERRTISHPPTLFLPTLGLSQPACV